MASLLAFRIVFLDCTSKTRCGKHYLKRLSHFYINYTSNVNLKLLLFINVKLLDKEYNL